MRIHLLVLIIILYFVNLLNAQCSDAGVCSIGDAFTINSSEEIIFNVGYNYGIGSPVEDVDFHSLFIKGDIPISKTGRLLVRWNLFNKQVGPLGTVTGIGDLFIIYSQQFWQDNNHTFNLSGGVKLATGNPNADPTLPQVYQPGLGTNDLLLGINYRFDSWRFQLGYQYVQRIRNANAVNQLKRGDDVYGELNYMLADVLAGGFIFKLMAIKRLQESEISDGNGGFITVPGSAQAQVNVAVNYTYSFVNGYALSTEAALPLLKREANVDGLTRYFTFAIQLRKSL